jgi:hypothetical protein
MESLMSTSAYRRILFVGPDDQSLKILPELDALYELGYEVRTLQSSVDDNRLFDAVRLQQYDILHIAAHGNKCQTQLTDATLDFGGIQQIARQCGARLVFLNECSSASIAQRLVNGGIPVAIGTFDDVDDAVAKQGAMTFYRELAHSNDPHVAYITAFSGEHYGFFANGGYAELITRPVLEKLNMLQGAQDKLNVELRRAFYVAFTSVVLTLATLVALGVHVLVAG